MNPHWEAEDRDRRERELQEHARQERRWDWTNIIFDVFFVFVMPVGVIVLIIVALVDVIA